jgi:hypothetical protein
MCFLSLMQVTGIAIIIDSFFTDIFRHALSGMLVSAETSAKVDLSIESMRSQRFGVGVFIFLMIGILVFCGIIYSVARGKHAPKHMKTGEKMMFGAIIMGVVVAVIFGATQMLSGVLF